MSDREIVSALAWRQRFGKFANIIVVLAVFAVPFLIPAGLLMLVDGKTDKAIRLLAAGVVDIIILVIGNKQLKKFTARTKELEGEYIVKNVLSERIDITQYSPNGYINRNYVKACSILPKFNRIKGSDYTTGYYRGREFTFCDLLLEWESESRDSDGHTHTHITTEFEGQVMILGLGKDIGVWVQIRERKKPRKKHGFLDNLFGAGSSRNIIETENEAFNSQFEIRASDGQLAFYILTPQFMERVMRLDEHAEGYTNIEFAGSNVVLTLNTGRDSFEIKRTLGMRRLEKYRQKFRDELGIYLDVLDEVLTKENLFS